MHAQNKLFINPSTCTMLLVHRHRSSSAGPAGSALAETLCQRFNEIHYKNCAHLFHLDNFKSPSYAPVVAMDNQVSYYRYYLFDRVPQCCI